MKVQRCRKGTLVQSRWGRNRRCPYGEQCGASWKVTGTAAHRTAGSRPHSPRAGAHGALEADGVAELGVTMWKTTKNDRHEAKPLEAKGTRRNHKDAARPLQRTRPRGPSGRCSGSGRGKGS